MRGLSRQAAIASGRESRIKQVLCGHSWLNLRSASIHETSPIAALMPQARSQAATLEQEFAYIITVSITTHPRR